MRSAAPLKNEIIAGWLYTFRITSRRGRSDDELRGEDVIPGLARARTHKDAVPSSLQGDKIAQAERFRTVGGKLDAVAGCDGGNGHGWRGVWWRLQLGRGR